MYTRDHLCPQAKLYPEYTIAHMPSVLMQASHSEETEGTRARKEQELGLKLSDTDMTAEHVDVAQPSTDHPLGRALHQFMDGTERVVTLSSDSADRRELEASRVDNKLATADALGDSRTEIAMDQPAKDDSARDESARDESTNTSRKDVPVDCCSILANAPVHGDHYDYHVDADPLTFPDCVWRQTFGDYCNRYQTARINTIQY